ncbi:XRE family transcriptional regulator [Streptomyces hoynatensis]|uniref:XRE family transcriptional regulator n=2 Tax=Streptomyces hoynatensis TaxID=1141874 RepID=A0A3A9Z4P9_9ACTN|nr:XRE family transcriptional regulator [Streptomyces hoynatensis]
MRALKEHSGLSLRQLGERAEERGDVLPRSTLADVLNRSTLPRPELLAAFVRACGGGEEDVREWLAARERVAAPAPREAGATARRRRGPLLWAAGAGLAALATLGAWAWWPEGEPAAGSRSLPLPDGEVVIHPADAPGLCLTEGRQRGGAYASAVAVQGPCDTAGRPRSYLRAVGTEDWYFVEWYKPSEGYGCLTLIDEGPAAGLFEPVNRADCSARRPEQHFRLEPVAGPGAASGETAYLLRHEQSGRCLAFAEDAEPGDADANADAGAQAGAGAEAVLGDCTGDSAQAFLIDATP